MNCPLSYMSVTGTKGCSSIRKDVSVNILRDLLIQAGERHRSVPLSPPSNLDCFADALSFILCNDTITYFLYYNLPDGRTKAVSKTIPYIKGEIL